MFRRKFFRREIVSIIVILFLSQQKAFGSNREGFWGLIFEGKKTDSGQFESIQTKFCKVKLPGRSLNFRITNAYPDIGEGEDIPKHRVAIDTSSRPSDLKKKFHCSVQSVGFPEAERNPFGFSSTLTDTMHLNKKVKAKYQYDVSISKNVADVSEIVSEDSINLTYWVKKTNTQDESRCVLHCEFKSANKLQLGESFVSELEDFVKMIAATVEVENFPEAKK